MYDLIPKIYLLEKVLSIDSIDYFYVPKIKVWQKKNILIVWDYGKKIN